MAKPPAFQFYANDFMDATSTWEANACGLYIRCLCKQWTHGSIPADLKVLARMIHTDRSELEQCWPVIAPKFVDQGDGTLKNSKLEAVRKRQQHVSKVRSDAGIAGAIAKANALSFADDLPQAKPKQRKEKVKEKEILFSESKYMVLETTKSELPALVVEGVDLQGYMDSIQNWSDMKPVLRTEKSWLATIRQWTKRDRDKGELKKLKAVSNGWNPRA
jgi:uncharacterized protein YdaU (DUF1376 family)